MRIYIRQSQLNRIIYKYLDDLCGRHQRIKKKWKYEQKVTIYIFDKENEKLFFYTNLILIEEPFEHGELIIKEGVIDRIVDYFKLRKATAVDIIADWFSEKWGVDVDVAEINSWKLNNK